jgi:hypothetical protein
LSQRFPSWIRIRPASAQDAVELKELRRQYGHFAHERDE